MPIDKRKPGKLVLDALKPADGPPVETDKLPWHPATAIIYVVLVFFVTQYTAAILISIYALLMGWSADQTDSWLNDSAAAQFVYVLLVETLTLSLIIFFLRRRKRALKDIGLLKPRLKDFGIALITYPPYFLVNIGALLAAKAIFDISLTQKQQTGFENVVSPLDIGLTFVSLVILPPIVEEIVMRGFLFGSLRKAMSVIWAAVITSIIFAIAHLQLGNGAPPLWAAAVDTFFLSLILCYLRVRTGSLWAGIFLHMIKNFLAFYALFVLT